METGNHYFSRMAGNDRKGIDMHTRIILPLDGSATSEAALPAAVEQAKAFRIPVHILRVVDTQVLEQASGSAAAFNYSMIGDMFEEESNDARAYVEEKVGQLQAEGVEATYDVRVGPVANTILDVVEEGDMIVMGSHGRSGIKRWVVGSIAEDVLRKSNVPVLLVRRPQT